MDWLSTIPNQVRTCIRQRERHATKARMSGFSTLEDEQLLSNGCWCWEWLHADRYSILKNLSYNTNPSPEAQITNV